MIRLRPLARTLGVILVTALALIGVLSLTRGTPLSHIDFGSRKRPPSVSDTAFRDLIALMSNIQFEPGNRVEQLLNGDGTYPRLWADLRAAQRTITIQMYYSRPGIVADTLASVLAERARAGVRVLLLLDAFGSMTLK